MNYLRTILITGGAGHIGSSLAKALVKDISNYIVIADNLSTGRIENLPGPDYINWKFIRMDVNDFELETGPLSAFSFDYIFHYAATVGVQRTLSYPDLVKKDMIGVENICELCATTRVKQIFYASSSEVYGSSIFPMREDESFVECKSPYAQVKYWGENRLKFCYAKNGIKYTILRFFNTYGPAQTSDFVIPKFLKLAISNTEIPVYGDGKQTRTFCYIDDNIEATLKIFYSGLYVNEIINIGHSQEYTILETAELIAALTGSSSKIIFQQLENREEINHRKPDNSKMISIIQKPLTPLKDGLRALINNYKLTGIISNSFPN